jgi:prophage antirepressor-like protein
MDDLMKMFDFNGNIVRTVIEKRGESWWVALDVCNILGLSDVSKSLQKLDADEKLIRKLFVSGQYRNVSIINEFGLYSLILTSTKPEAKAFKRWLTHEVIPQIRKTGKYNYAFETNRLIEKSIELRCTCIIGENQYLKQRILELEKNIELQRVSKSKKMTNKEMNAIFDSWNIKGFRFKELS